MYATRNFKTKKALKDAVKNGDEVGIFQPNDFFGNPKAAPDYSGTATLEGPHYPAAHTWYATVKVENGTIVKVS